MTRTEFAEQGDQLVAVVFGMGHQVAAAHVEPRDAVEQTAEAPFDGLERQPQVRGTRFAQDMEMQPFDARGQLAQLAGRDAQPRTGNAGVVEIRPDGRILRVDPQSARNAADERPLSETLELRHGIERDVVAATQYLVDVAIRIDGCVGMGRTAEFFENQTRFGGRRGRGTVGVPGQLGKDAPHGAGLQRDDHLGARLAAHAVDHGQVRVQQPLVENIARRRHCQKVDHRKAFL